MRWLILLCLWASPASAFTIETLLSDGCHERITLGAVGVGDPFIGMLQVSEESLARLTQRAEDELPTDRVTRAFIEDLADRYDFADRDEVEQWVLASLVAGSRAPDTRGHSLASLNDVRTTHVKDEFQPRHTLRRSSDNGVDGNAPAIAAARAFIIEELKLAHAAQWGTARDSVRWSFPFYGATKVQVFGPSYHLGNIMHTVQDSFTHTLRDDKLRILSVLNFAEAIRNDFDEASDGVAHSDRMDRCDVADPHDALRVRAAVGASALVVEAAIVGLESPELADDLAIDPALDSVYVYQPDCGFDNDYCDSTWLAEARKEPTAPINLLLCSSIAGAPAPMWWLGLGVLVVGWRRRRR